MTLSNNNNKINNLTFHFRERKNAKSKQKDAATEHKVVTDALAKFIAVLSRNQMDNNTGSISRKELETVFNKVM